MPGPAAPPVQPADARGPAVTTGIRARRWHDMLSFRRTWFVFRVGRAVDDSDPGSPLNGTATASDDRVPRHDPAKTRQERRTPTRGTATNGRLGPSNGAL